DGLQSCPPLQREHHLQDFLQALRGEGQHQGGAHQGEQDLQQTRHATSALLTHYSSQSPETNRLSSFSPMDMTKGRQPSTSDQPRMYPRFPGMMWRKLGPSQVPNRSCSMYFTIRLRVVNVMNTTRGERPLVAK